MDFGLLGPLQVLDDDGGEVRLSGAIRRVLLATLLLEGGRPVPVERLVECCWGDAAPITAVSSLHNHVLALRQVLRDSDGLLLQHSASGYLMRVEPDALDAARFAEHLRAGRACHQNADWPRASAEFAAALALWRGEVLAELPARLHIEQAAAELSEQRLHAWQWRIESDLQLGRHLDVIAELVRLVAAHPLREVFHSQLMLALYSAGRRAEALDAYQSLRRTLIEELGVEPSAAVRELHQLILTSDPRLAAPAALQPPANTAPPTPAQLPAAIRDFTGRQTIVRDVCRLLQDGSADGPARPVVVSAVTGTGGVGKTTLALQVSHQLLADYPDGQLYVSLRGTGTSPRVPGEVLAAMLRDLGEPDGSVPLGEDACSARYRSLTSGRRMLIVLDDARDAAQVRPLLPGSGTCAVLVTSRNRLPGLAGAVPVHLDVLAPAEALELFSSVVGAVRAGAEAEATGEVLGYCGGLPLAIRIVASRLAARPTWTVAAMAGRLRDEHRRLDELRIEDIAVRVSFRMSYTSLPESGDPGGMGLARAFRLLALAPGPDFTAHAAAALLDQRLDRTEDLLEALVDANLLEAPSPGRYRFHDLLLAFARELVRDEEPPAERREAAGRYVGWYLYASHAAMLRLRKYQIDLDVETEARNEPELEFADRQQAMAWCEAERFNFLAAIRLAAAERLGPAAWLLPRCLFAFYNRRGLWSDQREAVELGRASAREGGDRVSEAALLNNLISIRGLRFKSVDLALAAGNEALRINESLGNRPGQAHNMANVADTLSTNGRVDESLSWFRRAVDLYRQLELPHQFALTLNNMGYACCTAHRYDEALGPTLESLAIAREMTSRDIEASALDTLGVAYQGLGRLDEAIEALREAAAAYAECNDHLLEADTLDHLGGALLSAGHPADARAAWQQAVERFESLADPRADTIRDKLAALDSTREQAPSARPIG